MANGQYWYAFIGGQVQGPFAPEAIVNMIGQGIITPTTQVCPDGKTYYPAQQCFPQYFQAQAPVPPPAPQAAPPAYPQQAPAAYGQPPQAGYPQAAPGAYAQPAPGGYPQAAPGAYPQAAPGAYPQAAPGAYPQAAPAAAPRKGGGAGKWILLLLILVGGGVGAYFALGGGGGAGGSLIKELPVGDTMRAADIDQFAEMEENFRLKDPLGFLSEIPDDTLKDLFPKGSRGVLAESRGGGQDISVYCPKTFDAKKLKDALEKCGYKASSESGLDIYAKDGSDRVIAVGKGRIMAGEKKVVLDFAAGKIEKTAGKDAQTSELLGKVSSSSFMLNIGSGGGSPFGGSGAKKSATAVSGSSARITAQFVSMYEDEAAAKKACEEVQTNLKKAKEGMEKMKEAAKAGGKTADIPMPDFSASQSGKFVSITITGDKKAMEQMR